MSASFVCVSHFQDVILNLSHYKAFVLRKLQLFAVFSYPFWNIHEESVLYWNIAKDKGGREDGKIP